ncbi:YidB family protein [Streptomyces sp. NPDC054865]
MTSLSTAVESWVSTGPNEQVTGKDIAEQIDTNQLAEAATRAGTSPEAAADQLAQALPVLVDTITPGGILTEDPALIAQATETFERTTPFTVRGINPSADTQQTAEDPLIIDGAPTVRISHLDVNAFTLVFNIELTGTTF